MLIIDQKTGEAHQLRRSAINDDDWYLYDRAADTIVAAYGPSYKPDHTQTPRGLEWIRGLRLKLQR